MSRLIAQRLLYTVPTVLGVSIVVFLLGRVSGDPTDLLLPQGAPPEQRAEFRESYGLDRPLFIQYFSYMSHLVRGDFGNSIISGQPVLEVITDRAPATIELTIAAMVLAIAIGLIFGVLAAVYKDSLLDRMVVGVVVLGQSIATFWLGIMLILLFAVELRLFPVSGRGSLSQLVLPSVTLALFFAAVLTRLTRSSMLETLGKDFIRTAYSRGLRKPTVVVRHALRAGLIPIITVIGLQFGALLTGAVVTETVFSWPGLGSLVVRSITARDFPVVQGIVLILAVVFIMVNLLVDIIYALVDPRISHG